MAPQNLKDLTASQLTKLVADANAVLTQRHDEEVQTTLRNEFRVELDGLAAKWSQRLEATFPNASAPAATAKPVTNGNGYHKPPKARRPAITKLSKVAAKFRDKDGHTWSGRGKRPRWLTESIAAGSKIEDFRISA